MYIYLFIYLTDFVKTAQAEVKKKKKSPAAVLRNLVHP